MSRKFKILIADHNLLVRKFLVRELSSPCCEVVQAANHIQLFSKIYTLPPPDLVILDLDIPYLNGADVLRKLKNTVPDTPVIIFATFSEYSDLPIVRQADGFVEKNGDVEVLKAQVSRLLTGCYGEETPTLPGPASQQDG